MATSPLPKHHHLFLARQEGCRLVVWDGSV